MLRHYRDLVQLSFQSEQQKRSLLLKMQIKIQIAIFQLSVLAKQPALNKRMSVLCVTTITDQLGFVCNQALPFSSKLAQLPSTFRDSLLSTVDYSEQNLSTLDNYSQGFFFFFSIIGLVLTYKVESALCLLLNVHIDVIENFLNRISIRRGDKCN